MQAIYTLASIRPMKVTPNTLNKPVSGQSLASTLAAKRANMIKMTRANMIRSSSPIKRNDYKCSTITCKTKVNVLITETTSSVTTVVAFTQFAIVRAYGNLQLNTS